MIHKSIKTSTNKDIEVFDNVFTSSEKGYFEYYIQNKPHTLGSTSSTELWQKNKTFFKSNFSDPDINDFGFLNSPSFIPIKEFVPSEKFILRSCWSIASSPFSTQYYHVDCLSPNIKGKTLLYYVNNRWNTNWGGETIFSNDLGESEIIIDYIPGRIVIFDSTILHKASPISIEADEFRFIFSIQFIGD
jgi:Rps23 Pro-64 3,4-dihydroxylase Tpa1-like proline 4-hydroxylase